MTFAETKSKIVFQRGGGDHGRVCHWIFAKTHSTMTATTKTTATTEAALATTSATAKMTIVTNECDEYIDRGFVRDCEDHQPQITMTTAYDGFDEATRTTAETKTVRYDNDKKRRWRWRPSSDLETQRHFSDHDCAGASVKSYCSLSGLCTSIAAIWAKSRLPISRFVRLACWHGDVPA